jgi:hypothetical protein
LFELKQRFGSEVTILGGGGTEGANFMIRIYCIPSWGCCYQQEVSQSG